MKKFLAVFVTASLGLLFFSVAFAGNENNWKFNLSTGVNSQYLAKPGMVLYNRPIWENNFVISYRDSYYAGSWIPVGLNDRGLKHKKDFGDELQLFAGVKNNWRFLKSDLRFNYFVLNDFRKSRDDLWVFDGWLDFNVPLATPYLYVRYFGEVGRKSPERGWFYWVGLKRNQSLSDKVSLNLNALLAFSDGALSRDPGFIYGRLLTSVDVRISQKVSLSPFLTIQVPAGGQRGRRNDYTDQKEKMAVGVNLNFNF